MVALSAQVLTNVMKVFDLQTGSAALPHTFSLSLALSLARSLPGPLLLGLPICLPLPYTFPPCACALHPPSRRLSFSSTDVPLSQLTAAEG